MQQKTSRRVLCRCALRCPRKVKSLPWRKDIMVAADEQQKLGEKTLKHQAEVDTKFHTEEKKAAEIKSQVQYGNIEQPMH